ncbi:hypothetical protein HYS30_00475, partial [Candidatus Peregrinibacteria bacterium]|nr:hypothetical protein [Candidatus Peregrinibacteria bacterium]
AIAVVSLSSVIFADEATVSTTLTVSKDAKGNVSAEVLGAAHAVIVDVIDNDRPVLHLRVRVFGGEAEPLLTANLIEPKSLMLKGAVLPVRRSGVDWFDDAFGRSWELEKGDQPKEAPKNSVRGTLTWENDGYRNQLTWRFQEQGSDRVWYWNYYR